MTTKFKLKSILGLILLTCCLQAIGAEKAFVCNKEKHTLQFNAIPKVWDEGIPIGNGLIGGIIWQNGDHLRIALDRADLWDLRPVTQFETSKDYSFKFVCDQVLNKKDIQPVYELIDYRSRLDPAPTKIPAGALEFNIKPLGEVKNISLDLITAVCTIEWKQGTKAQFFVHAKEHTGRFIFENLPSNISPILITPEYEQKGEKLTNMPASVRPLSSLGYKRGKVVSTNEGHLNYHQKAWGDVSYDIDLQWKNSNKATIEGGYCITSKGTWYSEKENAEQLLNQSMKSSYKRSEANHKLWWKEFWQKSMISIPDSILQKQWYLETYKFGAASRKDAPPISLQAVWTADNGQTPPWRGDFHNDLNTQLSYWPGYSANHLTESEVFTDWLWKIKDSSEKWTQKFFGVKGMNIPCISTLDGKAIGGWSPYSHSPSTSGWLTHHFYLQWKYSMDSNFLSKRAYPWVKEAATYFENISKMNANGYRQLPLSSSPEFNDNRIDAWFDKTSNYDLANIKMTYTAAIEMANALNLKKEAKHWTEQLAQWPKEAVNENGWMIAPNIPVVESHRHLSHMLAFHPFGIYDISHGKEEKELILKSIKNVENIGPKYWIGYTYAWLANMKARVFDGEGAVRHLHTFVKGFCSPNSFHLNGDQTKSGLSSFEYRPFTLEGNFACASAIQEMLLQSHTGVVRVFPAIPPTWKNASFKNLRAMGAFIISADYVNGKTTKITIHAEKGGILRIINPNNSKTIEKEMKQGQTITLNL